MIHRAAPHSATLKLERPLPTDFKVTPSLTLNISGTVRDKDTVSMEYYALLNSVISTDLEQLSKVFNDAKHRAASLRQLSFLLNVE